MGSDQSKVIITQKRASQYDTNFNNERNFNFNQKIDKNIHEYYNLQKCNYPHNLIDSEINRKKLNLDAPCSKCNESHEAYKKYQICSKCLKEPVALHQNKKIHYQPNQGKYRIFKQNNFRQQNKKTYKQKQPGAIGPQIPVFFNGFSLPIEKYYKQKQNFGDFTTQFPRKEEMQIFRGNNKQLQISIIESKKKQERVPVSPSKLYQKIDYKGSQQILKLHF